jgi:membrane protein
MIEGLLRQLAGGSQPGLGLSFAIALAMALWGATAGVKALISGLNLVYGEDEKRGFIRLTLVAVALALAAIVFGLVALVLVAALPAALDHLPLGQSGKLLASLLRWPLLIAFMIAGLGTLYRLAPSRAVPRRRWVGWGAVAATLLWVAGSALFSFYVANFGKFNATYGSFAAVAVLLLWFELTSFCVLLGALLDAELERMELERMERRP